MSLVLILAIVPLMLLAASPILFLHLRKVWREKKNYERSLKMVPLLIHLPPPSDDIEGGNRDVRDITDETISKAQVVYSIIAGQFKKGFKNRFYGQKHFAFEIVAAKGSVHFYAAVPVSMIDVVQQAVVSAYPSARLEEVSEHNIFNPIGKITGTMGGELMLKEDFAYPIATYQDLKRDALQSVLNALSTLEKDDGAGIQFLIRPADPGWRKKAAALAKKKRSGKSGKSKGGAVFDLTRDFATALSKPPETWSPSPKCDAVVGRIATPPRASRTS